MPTVAWTLLAALGFWMIRTVPRAKNKTLKAVLVRVAAILFMVAGTISAGGFIGSWLRDLVDLAGQFGAGLAWILWFLGALSWLAGMVPEKWFKGEIPDWLSTSGLVLPALLASVPGVIGAGMTTAMHAASTTVGTGLTQLFSVQPAAKSPTAAAGLALAQILGVPA